MRPIDRSCLVAGWPSSWAFLYLQIDSGDDLVGPVYARILLYLQIDSGDDIVGPVCARTLLYIQIDSVVI